MKRIALHSTWTDDDARALAAWGVGAVLAATTSTTGVIHRTFLLRTSSGRYVLRAYRVRARERVEREHALIAYAHARGLPAPSPIPLPGGGTIGEQDGRYYAHFPFARGRQIARDDLGTAELVVLGGFLARLHGALADYPISCVGTLNLTFDRAAALRGIARLIAAIEARPAHTALDGRALEHLRGRRAQLEQSAAADAELAPLATLPWQAVHGDYQETNVLFVRGRISAVFDWEKACAAPRAWEMVRALDLMCRLDGARCRALLAGYRAVAPLPADDLDLAAAWYGRMRAHDLWTYEEVYLEGNERAARFIQPGPYVPFGERWRRLALSRA